MACTYCRKTSGPMNSSARGPVCDVECFVSLAENLQQPIGESYAGNESIIAQHQKLVRKEQEQLNSVRRHFLRQTDVLAEYELSSAAEKERMLADVIASREQLGHELPALAETSAQLERLRSSLPDDLDSAALDLDIERRVKRAIRKDTKQRQGKGVK
jgi:hypothetical protein